MRNFTQERVHAQCHSGVISIIGHCNDLLDKVLLMPTQRAVCKLNAQLQEHNHPDASAAGVGCCLQQGT